MIFCIILLLCFALTGARVRYTHLRGLRLSTLWETRVQLSRWQQEAKTFVWGRFRVPLSLASQNFLVAGTVGSGKTILLRLLMQSVFPRIGQGLGDRALVYDGKGDLLNVVLGMKQSYQTVFTFDPFEADGVRWDIAADVTDDASANQIARILFPKQDSEHQPFYPESVQNIAAVGMQTLHEKAPGEWRLSDLTFIMRSSDRMQNMLRETVRGQDLLSQFIHSGETWGNITATISNRLNDYDIVASLWDHAPHAVSLKEWSESESILVIRKNHQCTEVIDAINRVLIAVAKRHLLSKPEDPKRRTWVILDELASLGGKAIAKELNLLMEQGRSRNICVALGFQNIASLREEFGTLGADRLIALCSTKALLRFEDGASAEWAAGFFGKREVRVETTSSTTGQSASTTRSYQDQEKWTVQPSEFLAFPKAGAEHGVSGYFLIPDGDPPLAFRDTLPARWLFHTETLAPIFEREAQERPATQQRMAKTEAEIDALLGRTPALALPAPPEPPAREDIPALPPADGEDEPPFEDEDEDTEAQEDTEEGGGAIPAPLPLDPETEVSQPTPMVEPTRARNQTPPAPVTNLAAAPVTTVLPVPPPSPAPRPAPQVTPPASPVAGPTANPETLPDTPQVWDLRDQTVKPVSIWSVERAQV